MDVLLSLSDEYFFTPYVYPKLWPEDNIWRQLLSLNILVDVGGALLYLITATLSYIFIYDKRLLQHPLILKVVIRDVGLLFCKHNWDGYYVSEHGNQQRKEIVYTLRSVPLMGFLTAATFLLEVKGYSKLYDSVEDSKYGWFMIALSVVAFILFTDCCIYWIHRWLHHRVIYSRLHKAHHQWKVPTPFASHAFHPIDGFLQSLPYHLYVFLFPMHKFTYLFLYVAVNIWTVSIHDGDFRVPDALVSIINGSAHHTDHHLFYSYNYGQYFTLWDRIGGSFRKPSAYEGTGPLDQVVKKLELNDGRGIDVVDLAQEKKTS